MHLSLLSCILFIAIGLRGVLVSAAETQHVPTKSTMSYNNHHAQMLFDGDIANYISWGVGNAEHWIAAEFAASTVVNRIDLYQFTGTSYCYIRNFNIQGSQNGSNWITIATIQDFPKPETSMIANTVTFENTVAYKYYRIHGDPNACWPNTKNNFSAYLVTTEITLWHCTNDSGQEPGDPGDNNNAPAVDLSEVTERLDKLLFANLQLEYYLATLAAIAGLTMGLVLWRIVLLSKNQRRLF